MHNFIHKIVFRFVIILISITCIVNVSYAIDIIINGVDGGVYSDSYNFSNQRNSNISINLVDKFSNDFISGNKRIEISQPYNTGDGILHSELYGDFYIVGGKMFLIKDNENNSNCAGNVSYSFSGTLKSPNWGEEFRISSSYYCPDSQKYGITLDSDLFGNVVLGGNSTPSEIVTINARGETRTGSTSDIFDNKKISITGLTSLENKTGTDSEYSKTNGANINTKIEGKMMNLNASINKNLVTYTNGLTPIKNNDDILDSLNNKITYYDFEGQEGSLSNTNNKGKIQQLGNGGPANSFDDIKVEGQKLLYIKGGNLYINADIYNKDSNSGLVIVVKRDSTNNKNGGNIYIDPDVTNIDAVLIADGSIISYNGTTVLNAKDHTLDLKRQLLIYGSISTKNTFGDDKAIYGTDDYIDNGGKERNSNYYNLANLRSFQIKEITTLDGDKKITSYYDLDYSFAGKKKQYLSDSPLTYLRSTEKITPLVIEYNPNIQTNPHFILKN